MGPPRASQVQYQNILNPQVEIDVVSPDRPHQAPVQRPGSPASSTGAGAGDVTRDVSMDGSLDATADTTADISGENWRPEGANF
jgi:hypothetical protein